MATSSYSPVRRVLHSWKEISGYTGRGVRTVQRYEVQFGFPIHRPAGSPRSAVLAFTDEIDDWLAGSPTRVEQPQVKTRPTDHVARMHDVWLKAKLGCERAESMTQRLLATKALLNQLTQTMNEARTRRQQLLTHIHSSVEVARKLPPPPAF